MMQNPEDALADFAPDPVGLQVALDTLIYYKSEPGKPTPWTWGPRLTTTWPELGRGGMQALIDLAEVGLELPTRVDHPGFLAHMDPPTPWFTWAAAQWAAAMNQNLLHPDVAPTMRDLEQQVITWMAPSFGMGGGHLVPGSSLATLTALWAARDARGVTEIVSSAASHLSVAKAARVLGLPHRVVPVDDEQQIDVDQLGDLSTSALVLTAGTVSTGAIDPLNLAGRARWTHVDAAWAGPLVFSIEFGDVLDGISGADSVGFSAHKWLHQPKESAAILFADNDEAEEVLSFGGDYLSAPNIGLLGSSGARALPLAATFLAWGRYGLAAVIDTGMLRIEQLERIVLESDDLEAGCRNRTGVLLWRPIGASEDYLRATQRRLEESWVSIAIVDGEAWFRSVGANPMADPALVVSEIRGENRDPGPYEC